MYTLLYIHGLRKGEMLALDKERDFIYKKILFWKIPVTIIVRYAEMYDNLNCTYVLKDTKTGTKRYVDLDLFCAIKLYRYFKELKTNKVFDFRSNSISVDFHKIIVNSGFDKRHQIRLYDLRHLHASLMLLHSKNRAYTLKILQERLRSCKYKSDVQYLCTFIKK